MRIFFIWKCKSFIIFFFDTHLFRLCFCVYTVQTLCFLSQDQSDILLLSCWHYRTSRFDDPGFRLCDLFQGISDHSQMINTDRCKYCANCILNYIRRICLSAETGFQYNQIAFLFLKIQKSHRRLYFKHCRNRFSFTYKPVNCFFYLFHDLCKFWFRDPFPIYLYLLQIRNDCRWNISPGFVSCLT